MSRLWEYTLFYFILFLTPLIFVVQMVILFPQLVQIVEAGPIQQYVHVCLASLLLMNIVGNMIMSSTRDFSIFKEVLDNDKVYCNYCKRWRPPDCLHCKKCNTCVMKRDHHCTFLVNCIGRHNRRYYILFLGHVAIAMTYSSVYNYFLFTPQTPDDWSLLVYFARIVNPGVWFLLPAPVGKKDIYMMFMLTNACIGFWAAYLFCYHMRNSAFGVTAYEEKYKPEKKNLKKWKENLLRVFGEKWYWAAIWPFSSSPLPRAIKSE